MSERGFTLVEAVIALGIMAIVLVGLLPTFQVFMDANSLSETRSDAVAAAQEAMEALRREDPGALPNSGNSAIQTINAGNHEFEVLATYCSRSEFCDANSRHILLEVSYGGRIVYAIETVYTRLR